jgi:G8 domain-containing protein
MIVVSRTARRSIVWALLAAFGPAASDTLTQSALPFRIPDFCATATITSAASGRWPSPATWSPSRIPIAGDVVRINNGHIVTSDAVGDVAIACVGVHGALRFRTDINTRLKVGTLMAMPDGELTVGTPSRSVAPNVVAELVIANPLSSRHFISIDEISNSFLPMKEGGFQWLFLADLAVLESTFSSLGGICSKR